MKDGDIEEKFLALAEPVLGKARSRKACDSWRAVAACADMAELLDLLDIPAQ